jgi:hypothetical protein
MSACLTDDAKIARFVLRNPEAAHKWLEATFRVRAPS